MKTTQNTNRQFKVRQSLSLFMAIALALFTLQGCKKDDAAIEKSAKYKELHEAMHDLWSAHMQYTYSTVDAFFNNSDALGSNLTRLLKNQEDIGNGIKPFYGEAAGNLLIDSLKAHINGAVPILTAVKDGADPTTAINAWYNNAKNIGLLLQSVNPHWEAGEMEHMMKMHIDQTIAYALALHSKDYTDAIKKYDEAFEHMAGMMADMLSDGIAKQFPEKF